MWQIGAVRASWVTPQLRFDVDLNAPEAGLRNVSVLGQPTGDLHALQWSTEGDDVRAEMNLQEVYGRETDLVANFAEPRNDGFRLRAYWRQQPTTDAAVIASLELILAVHTHRLGVQTRLRLASEFGSEQDSSEARDLQTLSLDTGRPLNVEAVATGGNRAKETAGSSVSSAEPTVTKAAAFRLFRPQSGTWSYAEMVHPDDLRGSQLSEPVSKNAPLRVESRLLEQELEKGVIRVARVQALWLQRDGDVEAARTAMSRFLASPPPLTA